MHPPTFGTNPGCTLRFTEVLAKMCGSEFRIGELLYLFNAEPPQHCENPFPMQDVDDVLAYRFHAGAPAPEGEKPDFELAEKSQWRVTLQLCRWLRSLPDRRGDYQRERRRLLPGD